MSVSDKKGKITLSDLIKNSGSGGGSNTNNYPSFRFSPESEQMEEVKQKDSPGNEESDTSSVPTPTSPKPASTTGGDTSPLKEILRSKWANKWDKRSLSLDLDLKSKIHKAIEDKRKSIVSHFIPEETGVVIPSTIIAEYTNNTTIDENYQDNFLCSSDLNIDSSGHLYSSSRTSTSGGLASSPSLNLRIQHHTQSSIEVPKMSTSEPTSPMTGLNHHRHIIHGHGHGHQILDEIGFEIGESEVISEHVSSFCIPSEKLEEFYDEVPSISAYRRNNNSTSTTTNLFETSGKENNLENGISSSSRRESEIITSSSISRKDLSIPFLVRKMFWVIIDYPLFSWFIGLLSVAFVGTWAQIVPFLMSMIWFVSGVLGASIVFLAWTDDTISYTLEKASKPTKSNEIIEDSVPPQSLVGGFGFGMALGAHKNVQIQGWLGEMENYDPFLHELKLTKVVFARLEGTVLYISHLHSKHRIPKRRMFDDTKLTGDVWFNRHSMYELAGASVFIAPLQLAKKRIWSKKYPIGIQFPQAWEDASSICNRITILPKWDSLENLSTSNSAEELLCSEKNDEIQSKDSKDKDKDKSNGKNPSPFNSKKREVRIDNYSGKVIYLFARTDREKDIWFRRLTYATKSPTEVQDASSQEKNLIEPYLKFMKRILPDEAYLPQNPNSSNLSLALEPNKLVKDESKDLLNLISSDKDKDKDKDKIKHLKNENNPVEHSSSRKSTPDPSDFSDIENILTVQSSPLFLNAIIGRIFFDFLRSPHWNSVVQGMIQKKLNYIKKPQFLDALVVRELDLGTAIPVIHKASSIVFDSQGLWIDLDITYEGNLLVTLETKLNLMKLKKVAPNLDSDHEFTEPDSPVKGSTTSTSTSGSGVKANLFDSDADDSGESSEEDYDPYDEFDFDSEIDPHKSSTSGTPGGDSKGKRILKMAERIVSSKYVQNASELSVVKKAIANVSSIALVLAVTLKKCDGTLAINIPPPPGNILWYGFRTNPQMEIVARPKIGSRNLNVHHITEWLQKKLLHEFQRVVVMPNMNDAPINLMDFELPK